MSGVRRQESLIRARPRSSAGTGAAWSSSTRMANWTDLDVEGYIADHDVPVNPLLAKGYPSIGCWPCTRPVEPGEDGRAGRWSGLTKTECGLHDELESHA